MVLKLLSYQALTQRQRTQVAEDVYVMFVSNGATITSTYHIEKVLMRENPMCCLHSKGYLHDTGRYYANLTSDLVHMMVVHHKELSSQRCLDIIKCQDCKHN